MGLVWVLVVGAIAGWLAGRIMRGGGFGLVGNIVVGILGAVIGSWLLRTLGVSPGGGLAGTIATAVIGALVLLSVVGLIKR